MGGIRGGREGLRFGSLEATPGYAWICTHFEGRSDALWGWPGEESHGDILCRSFTRTRTNPPIGLSASKYLTAFERETRED